MKIRSLNIPAGLVAFAIIGACSPSSDIEKLDVDEALYMERFDTFLNGRAAGLNTYDPLAPVDGTEHFDALATADAPTISPEALKSAEDYASARNSTALIIARDGKIEFETYFGETTPDTLINSRSLAKPLGVIAIGRAIQEGHIKSVDQPAADFITEWQSTDKAPILIRHLLDMRSGLLPQDRTLEADNVLNRAYLHPRHDEVIINEYPLVDVPGERYEYSNANAELVAVLIERATGVQYEDWVSKQVLAPIGARGGQVWMNRVGGTAHAGCCILLPAESYFRLATLYLNDGNWNDERLLPDGFVKDVSTPTAQNPHAGMGVYVAGTYVEKRGPLNPDKPLGQTDHSEPYLAGDLFLFDGNGHQVAYIIPSANLVILRTGGHPDEDLGWDNAFLPNTILNGLEFPNGEEPLPQPR